MTRDYTQRLPAEITRCILEHALTDDVDVYRRHHDDTTTGIPPKRYLLGSASARKTCITLHALSELREHIPFLIHKHHRKLELFHEAAKARLEDAVMACRVKFSGVADAMETLRGMNLAVSNARAGHAVLDQSFPGRLRSLHGVLREHARREEKVGAYRAAREGLEGVLRLGEMSDLLGVVVGGKIEGG